MALRHISESADRISLILKGSEGKGKKGIDFRYRLQRKVWGVKYRSKFVVTRDRPPHVEITLRFCTEPNRVGKNVLSKSVGART